MLPFCCVCIVYSMLYSPKISYILYGQSIRTVRQLITLFASLLLLLLLLLIVIYNGVGTYDEMIIMDLDLGLVC